MDEQGCTCQRCNSKYKVDFILPDNLYREITGCVDNGLFCGRCLVELIEERDQFNAYFLKETQKEEKNHNIVSINYLGGREELEIVEEDGASITINIKEKK